MRIKGKVERSDLEGGYFTFSDGKETYKLEGGGKDLLAVGVAAEVEGKVKKDGMGIGFGMPVLKVKSYKILAGSN
ncbi:MAG: hypothetical protein EXR72_04125 [Myxococcales bacterium]|nr:hypothetical protein [Myxococcales bacterium]